MKNHFQLVFLQTVFLLGNSAGFESSTTWNGGTFDFIIVGGGTAGCVIARRLAENGKHSVLMIEEGGIPHPDLAIPALSMRFASDPDYVRILSSVPQAMAARKNNGVLRYTYGRMLGGSSSVNGMMLNRGNPNDLDEWARLVNDVSWSYKNMLKYFKKSENYTGNLPSNQRGFDGPLTISQSMYAPGRTEFLNGGLGLGYPIAESNGPQTISFTEIEYTRKFGRRVSAYTGYIEPLLSISSSPIGFTHTSDNANLLILINSEAKQVIFEGKRATGVRFVTNSTFEGFAKARKEVIVTAGVMGSPLLLQKSGIGPKHLLKRANIPVVNDLKAGYNLQDHAVVFLRVIFNDSSAAFNAERDLNAETWRIFNKYGEGPYITYMGTVAQAFITSSVLPSIERLMRWPDIQLIATHDSGNSAYEGVNHELEANELAEEEVAVQWMNLIARPRSTGTVFLNTTDPDGDPKIDFGYYNDPHDFQVMLDAIKVSISLCEETMPLQGIGCRLPRSPLRECRHTRYRSDDYWMCYLKQLTTTGVHGAATNKMGRSNDPDAVVDSELRVIGVEGLRVADASIMPKITNANIQAVVYAIAEKASEMILKTWERSPGQDLWSHPHHSRFAFLQG